MVGFHFLFFSLLLLHSNPPVWWIAQFVWYLMRFQPSLEADMDSNAQRLGFKGSVVGYIHLALIIAVLEKKFSGLF